MLEVLELMVLRPWQAMKVLKVTQKAQTMNMLRVTQKTTGLMQTMKMLILMLLKVMLEVLELMV